MFVYVYVNICLYVVKEKRVYVSVFLWCKRMEVIIKWLLIHCCCFVVCSVGVFDMVNGMRNGNIGDEERVKDEDKERE